MRVQMPCDEPRTMRSPEVRHQRRLLLAEPHIAPLAQYVEGLRIKYRDREFPDIDPFDGGVEASMLFLQEKPGPMTAVNGKRTGSGFISADNDDPTAEAAFLFLRQAGIDRKDIVRWNVIPGWNGTIHTTSAELREGINELTGLLALLPGLRTVVLVGRKAQRARPLLSAKGLLVFESMHPSARNRASRPDQWKAIPEVWRAAALA